MAQKYNYSTTKNEIISFLGKWMKSELIMFIESSQSYKNKYPIFSLISEIKKENKRNKSKRRTMRDVGGKGRGRDKNRASGCE